MRRWARWVAVGAGLAVALAVGLIGVRAWSGRGDWPARLMIRPSAGSWPMGLTRDGRSYRTGHGDGVTTWDLESVP